MKPNRRSVLRVTRTKAQAKTTYDRIAPVYDYVAGVFERSHRDLALKRLNIKTGETALEIGFGTGHCLQQIAEAVEEKGRVYGIDISSEMLLTSRRRLQKAGLLSRVQLACGDAATMPYAESMFDVVFSSFSLELFDSPEIPTVLAEIKRILRPTGRVGIVSMSNEGGVSLLVGLYDWLHVKFPKYCDCRPINLEESLRHAGFAIQHRERISLLGLPGEIVVGILPKSC